MENKSTQVAGSIGGKKVRKVKVSRTREQKSILRAVASLRDDAMLIREFVNSGKPVSMGAVLAAKQISGAMDNCLAELHKTAAVA